MCVHEWEPSVCRKPKVKCAERGSREFAPLTDSVITEHLLGRRTVGVYPLLPDETCWFFAIDLDKASWRDDVAALLRASADMGVPLSIERSRSGNGAHAWVFFESPVRASSTRSLGCALLTKAIEIRHQIGLDSYDRLFPNQDTMPKGGFGNLIALPLQPAPGLKGNSLFLDAALRPYTDQWAYLSTIRRMSSCEVDALVRMASRTLYTSRFAGLTESRVP